MKIQEEVETMAEKDKKEKLDEIREMLEEVREDVKKLISIMTTGGW